MWYPFSVEPWCLQTLTALREVRTCLWVNHYPLSTHRHFCRDCILNWRLRTSYLSRIRICIKLNRPHPSTSLSFRPWHPPAIHVPVVNEYCVLTLILDKLVTRSRWSCQTCQLKLICLCVCDITQKAAPVIKAIYQRSVFAVVTDDCHAKFVLARHITENSESVTPLSPSGSMT